MFMKWIGITMLILSFPVRSAEIHYQMRVDGLACPFCAYGMEKKIKALAGVDKHSVVIELNRGIVSFVADTQVPLTGDVLKVLVNDAGFTLQHLETTPSIKNKASQ